MSSRAINFFIKRLRKFSSHNRIRFEEWDEKGLFELTKNIVQLFEADDGADQILAAYFLLVEWNPRFRCEKQILVKFLTGKNSIIKIFDKILPRNFWGKCVKNCKSDREF